MKIYHISDLHFGYNKLEILDAFNTLVNDSPPDLILISGDLTHRAKTEQLYHAKQFIDQLPCKALLIPGNHDIPLHSFWSRAISPYQKYQSIIHPSTEIYHETETLQVVGLNSVNPKSVKKGRISKERLNALSDVFKKESPTFKILMLHHNISQVKHYHKPVHAADKLINVAKELGIHLICTGHLHYSKLLPVGSPFPIIAHAGSLCCERTNDKQHSFYQYELTDTKLDISQYVFNETKFKETKLNSFQLKSQ